MKKALLIGTILLMVSTTALAGPLLGLQLIPTKGETIGFNAGWAFSNFNAVVQKYDLSSIYGGFSLAAIWTPPGNGFLYRGGVGLDLAYGTKTGAVWKAGPLVYNGLYFIVGASKTWQPFTVYGDIQMSSRGVLTPVVGVNVLFDLFGPPAPATE